jgi:hypothetical protein
VQCAYLRNADTDKGQAIEGVMLARQRSHLLGSGSGGSSGSSSGSGSGSPLLIKIMFKIHYGSLLIKLQYLLRYT